MKQVMKLEIESISSNEAFARVVVAAFATRLNPTMEEVADIKTAVSEAVTNAIIHGYEQKIHKILIEASIEEETFTVSVEDFGAGIEDVEKCFVFAMNIGHEMLGALGQVQNGTQLDDLLAGLVDSGVLLGEHPQVAKLCVGKVGFMDHNRHPSILILVTV